MSVENKRHTNAHQPSISLSPTDVSIPPSPPFVRKANKNAISCRLLPPLLPVPKGSLQYRPVKSRLDYELPLMKQVEEAFRCSTASMAETR
jgi:hypothetical protein